MRRFVQHLSVLCFSCAGCIGASAQGVTLPAATSVRTVADAGSGVTFELPAGWSLNRHDGEVSTFHLDARAAPRRAEMRAVASISSNPFPSSTFSGAFFYLSVTLPSSAAACTASAGGQSAKVLPPVVIGEVRFHHGHDEHGGMCVQARDEIYTAFRKGSCVRFDLAVNNFCGGDASGVKDMSPAELAAIFGQLEGILRTVRFGREARR